jgi:diguanylate cyclase (GGDEF)-like protein/PAS domain S-box-containing protein
MRLVRRHGWWITALTVFGVAALLRAGGLFQSLEFAATDARAGLLAREVESDIVIVGIDTQSLAAIDRWPWPRRHHADLIGQLSDAAPKRVFLDIDFSSHSNALDDALLESALASWRGAPIVLPTFFQALSGADGTPALTRPLDRFLPHVQLAAVNRRPGADGLERAWRSSWNVDGQHYRSVIDPEGRLPPETEVPIDFSISPGSFAYVSYIDLLHGRVPADALRGKTVFVGATAVELGDMVPVPLHRSLPGVVLQALAHESIKIGPQRSLSTWQFVLALAGWTLVSAVWMRARAWRRNALVLAGALLLIAAVSVYAAAAHRLLLEVVPFALATIGVFLVAILRSLDRQTWRAMRYALGMRRRDALLRSIAHSSSDCIVCVDQDGLIQTANPAAARLFACPASGLVGVPIIRFIPELAMTVGSAAADPFAALDGEITEWNAQPASGDPFPVELAVGRVRLHSERLYTAIVRDISERRAQQQRLEHQATHDSLTGLPNRAALMQQLEAALTADGAGRPIALLMLDLCRFKEVNDTLGHDVGDRVLREVAQRFQQAIGAHGFIARIGGDEFTALIDGQESRVAIAAIAQRLTDGLRKPIDVAGISIEVGLSIGVACGPRDTADPQTLLKYADVAMYVAKRRGTPFECYDAASDENTVRRLALGAELRTAIQDGALELHYQPQVNFRTGRVESVEALLRWPHPTLGQVSPAEFVAIAEATDMIRPLTEWTLAQALTDSRDWRRRGLDVRVAANLSARLLQDTAFPERLRMLLASAGGDATSLELEITESAMMLDPARALRIIQEIARLGVLIAIDDYGSGYSSLGYLRDLPVHALKLDKSFVQSMRTSADDRIIVESTVQMAHALKMQVVAEGVESDWDARFLATTGYDYGQGYHYSRALPAAQCAEWIEQYNTAAEFESDRPKARLVRA